MRSPSRAGWWALAAAGSIWVGTGCGLRIGIAAAVALGCMGAVVALRQRAVAILVTLAAVGAISGALASARIEATMSAAVPTGPVALIGVVAEDDGPQRPAVVRPEELRRGGQWTPWRGPPLAVGPDPATSLVAGQRVMITGTMRASPGRVRGDPIAGRVTIANVEVIETVGGPFYAVGNAVRDRVRSILDLSDRAQALVSGFLIGDTSGLGPRDLDALRRSGLTHFVAVSGSNVALFLAAWWVLTAFFGIGPKRRFVLGVIGLGIFVVATRWESSVLRAAFMAATVLGAAAAGIVIDTWVAVGVAVGVLLLASGQLAVDVGFQLSVAATVGIMVGAGVFSDRRPKALWATLGAATAAQVAVIPVLLWHFGTVPLMSPIANLFSAPLVTGATVSGSVAVVSGWAPAVLISSTLASGVLAVSEVAARWPQLGPPGVAAVAATGALVRWPRTRPLAMVGIAAFLAISTLGTAGPPSVPTVTFLDIGQGDATLLRDSGGGVALVDGGRDPLVLAEALRRHDISRIDLLVASHGDIDHIGGFAGILNDHSIGRIWIPDHPDWGEELVDLIDRARIAEVPIDVVGPGISYRLGTIAIEALGPRRRYLTRNDGSIVLWVEAGGTLLLPGDIEAIPQRELPTLQPDILLVPHHGSASTDRTWLAATVGAIAVISVGPNTFGHPSPEIRSTLATAGAEVRVTMEDGDITLPLDVP
ncbi:MAG: ComEC/Rec2 family competence protein [Actinomycetota bacterium]|nr:ComEC/Rec2 family competence protein [Actinomycetota bacterium]